MKSQMLFIEPTAAQVHIFSQFTLPRLGSFILAGLVRRRSAWNARVFIEGSRHFDLDAWTADLDALPIPDFSLADGTADCVMGGKKTVVVQTSRGCPFDCSFCSVTGMFGRTFRHRSVEAILKELRPYNTRDHFIFFCDDNFTANRRRARQLLEAVIGAGFRFQWSTQVRADVARDPELVRLMKRAGCHTVFIGFESVNPTSLKEMKKGQSLDDMRNAIRVFHSAGIHIHGMFVFGFEGDNWATVESTVQFIRQMKLTSVQLLLLTPLPGSDLYRRLMAEERITSFDWDLYDTQHVVYRPSGFTPFELQCAQVYGHTQLYALPEGIKKLASGRWVSAGLSFYARKINRDWQKRNQAYLRALADASGPAGVDGIDNGCGATGDVGWTDATRRPNPGILSAPPCAAQKDISAAR